MEKESERNSIMQPYWFLWLQSSVRRRVWLHSINSNEANVTTSTRYEWNDFRSFRVHIAHEFIFYSCNFYRHGVKIDRRYFQFSLKLSNFFLLGGKILNGLKLEICFEFKFSTSYSTRLLLKNPGAFFMANWRQWWVRRNEIKMQSNSSFFIATFFYWDLFLFDYTFNLINPFYNSVFSPFNVSIQTRTIKTRERKSFSHFCIIKNKIEGNSLFHLFLSKN